MSTIDLALKLAEEHERAGRTSAALSIYRSIRAAVPGHPIASAKCDGIERSFGTLYGAMQALVPNTPVPMRILNYVPNLHYMAATLKTEQVVPTLAWPDEGDAGLPSDRLLSLMEATLPAVRGITFPTLDGRCAPDRRLYRRWPGEHYALIAAIVHVMQPRLVVEFGTDTGLCTLSIADQLPPESRVVTYDIRPWKTLPDTVLRNVDFDGGRIVQKTDNLIDPNVFARHRDLLREADIIFLDGPKDVVTERAVLTSLETVDFPRPPLLILDDIKWPHMVEIWHGISRPKLDVSGFGHWCGTGLVDWIAGGSDRQGT